MILTINKKLGLMKPKVFQEWFAQHFPNLKSEWQSYYESAGGKIRKDMKED